VRAWGANWYGELGDNTINDSSSPVQVAGPGGVGVLDNVVAVAAGYEHSLALLSDGTVRAWGWNGYGQLGDNTFNASSSPVKVVGPGGVGFLDNVVAVAAGNSYSLALLSDGTVRAWGNNESGKLGDNTINSSSSPVQVAGPGGVGVLDNVVAVSAGSAHSLALLSDGTVRAWGYNGNGELGDGTIFDHAAPVAISSPGTVVPNGPPVADAGPDQPVSTGATVQLDGTGSHDPDGDPLTYMWYLYVPDGSSAFLSSATSPTPTFVADVPGQYQAYLFVSDGKTISYASVTITAAASDTTPPTVGSGAPGAGGTGVGLDNPIGAIFSEAIDCGTVTSDTFSVRTSSGFVLGDLVCTGGTVTFTPWANLLPSTAYTVTVSGGAGGVKDLAGNPMAADYTWTFTTGTTPLGAPGSMVAIDAGGYHSLALSGDGHVWGWGYNEDGELGTGSTSTGSVVPVRTVGPGGTGTTLDNVVAMSAGDYHSLALLSDGTVSAWGANWGGQLGDNTNNDNSLPVQVVGPGGVGVLDNVVAVSAGGYHSLALLSDGTVRAWGYNRYSELGDGTTSDSTSPVQVVGPGGVGILDNVVAVSAGYEHSLALLSDGTVRAWGYNGEGTLGDNTIDNRSSPVQVVGSGGVGILNNVVAVSAGTLHSLALLSDGTVRAWGYNGYGQLGDGMGNNSSSPVQVVGPGGVGVLDNVVAVSAGGYHSLALLSDGTVRAWGGYGELGDNTNNSSSSPVQVVGPGGVGVLDNVVAVSAGFEHSLALLSDGTVRAWGNNREGELGDGTMINRSVPAPISVPGSVLPNDPPVADAGSDQSVTAGATIQLDGTGSTDPDGDPLTYRWYVYQQPSGPSAVLSDATSPTPTFVADVSGQYQFVLYVSDGKTISSASVIITANSAPTANAGADSSVITGATVVLDGSASSDPDGDTVTYSWAFASIPGGSTATLTGATTATPSFTADVAGSYTVTLTVFDGSLSASGNVVITVSDPDTWQPTSTDGAPAGRTSHTAFWTGSTMIVWGGYDSAGTSVNTGGRYDPATNSWTATSVGANVPQGRSGYAAVWTGSTMIVWGGDDSAGTSVNTGGRYDPATDSWTATSTGANVPQGRSAHTAVWTGSAMIVWGGYDSAGTSVNTGGRYDPVTDNWTAISTGANVPTGRYLHTAVWTGSRMVVWGGYDSAGTYVNTGGRYNPAADTWQPTSTTGAPAGRTRHTAVWTGSGMIVWGGDDSTGRVNTGGRYDPATDNWVTTSTTGAPTGRYGHTAVWTGSRMIVWGGYDSTGTIANTGGLYDPAMDNWTATSTGANVPQGRSEHTAVWTGSRMIVWGGFNGGYSGYSRTGGRYDPAIVSDAAP
jgi:alpha-tubulin suppressor-like RCC1 family protein